MLGFIKTLLAHPDLRECRTVRVPTSRPPDGDLQARSKLNVRKASRVWEGAWEIGYNLDCPAFDGAE
jgi:hypothetical protein